MEPSVTIFGPLDTILGPYIEWVLLVLAVANIATRGLAHHRHLNQAEDDGAENIARFLPHEATNVALVLAAVYYATLHPHGGIVTSVLVVGVFLSDFFEFEARQVEARRDIPLERPKSGIAASLLLLLYVAYQSLFYLIEPFWSAVV